MVTYLIGLGTLPFQTKTGWNGSAAALIRSSLLDGTVSRNEVDVGWKTRPDACSSLALTRNFLEGSSGGWLKSRLRPRRQPLRRSPAARGGPFCLIRVFAVHVGSFVIFVGLYGAIGHILYQACPV